MTRYRGFGTRSVHAGEAPDPTTGAFGVPIYQNTTYGFRSYDQLVDWRDGGVPHFHYLRDGNPTTRCLEVKLADLEGTEAAVAGASGMAVISAMLLHLVPAGGRLVASADIYSVTQEFIREGLAAHAATAAFVDFTDLAAVATAIGLQTRALYTEAFSNPALRGGQPATRAFLNALDLCTIAVCLGDCDTLIWPFERAHGCDAPDAAPAPLLRLSVGIEDGDDLEADLATALAAVERELL